MNRTIKLFSAIVVTASFCAASAVFAESYYRWKDETGQVHYGSRPPHGVEAVKIKAHGGGTSEVESDKASQKMTQEEKVDPQAIIAQRQKQCEEERNRLSTLKSSGRIRMTQEDGSTRYLTAEEVAKEVKMSQEFLKEACK